MQVSVEAGQHGIRVSPHRCGAAAAVRCLRTIRTTNTGLSTIDGQRFWPFARAPIDCSPHAFLNPTECEIECTKHRLCRFCESCLAFEVIQIIHIRGVCLCRHRRRRTRVALRVAKNTARTHWSLLSAIKWGRSRLDDSIQTRRKPGRPAPCHSSSDLSAVR